MDTANGTGTISSADTTTGAGTASAISGGTAPARYRPGVAPPWVQLTTLALLLGGLGVSLYLTIAHYTTPAALACPDAGIVNCAKVTTSPQSVLFGIVPVALLGLLFYLFMAAVNTPWAWRAGWPAVRWAGSGRWPPASRSCST